MQGHAPDRLEEPGQGAGLRGFSYEEADNGLSALEAARKTRPDLVVSDLNMPKMNGMELIEALISSLRPERTSRSGRSLQVNLHPRRKP